MSRRLPMYETFVNNGKTYVKELILYYPGDTPNEEEVKRGEVLVAHTTEEGSSYCYYTVAKYAEFDRDC